ncbi:hypothetical protein LX77_00944 [Gelidibacter algens]|uniref:2'-5' RNA ligase superfamily protein n=1 Tax=Gelidibacter algens TaxID=49280 RepID=A0A1A7R4U1_9FLAO|nr:hypothetical protein [Gelidibacter algens]OBX26489.1 hypothetical protein A9996_04120 [Gelidibacter algens]RAJ26689.1 hypothetical protein LX77_00944 [Gelidibacter algens]
MKNNYLLITLILFALTNSCAQNQQKVIAINVLLTLPEDVAREAIQLNGAILKNHPKNITLNDNQIPHITLLQCYVQETNLPKIEKLLLGLYKTIKNDTLLVDELQYKKDKTESFASMGIEKSKSLMALHKKTISLLEPYILDNGSQESYVQNADGTPIDEFTITYVPKFVSAHSFENYNPHISLGVAKTSLLDSLAEHNFRTMKFQAASISVYQLGAFGTAQKLLWESE